MKVTTTLLTLSNFAYLGLCSQGGLATIYKPPYLPTKCYGGDSAQFPGGNLFGAVGPDLWDGGAACGRKYEVRCMAPAGGSGKCKYGTVTIKIVEGRLGKKAPSLSLTVLAGQIIYTGSGTFKAEFEEVA
ncbi:hypothetical protein Vi05172_g11449 [Venturia inaequalis]|uniref:Plant natriuretic peptide-like 2a n=2 Tax=Venturia inaequalis TaxID=5025 RepID=A0A370IXN3_VENIN|nr:plant natriuretic peptide-like 2a [Venturia inaequalis]QDH43448.1 plant natriuretic peptide-like 2b [Venturia inaequalis]RDI78555.1 hypothetical protein Vi05172_g11449 [Venturia inaequalis]